MTERLLTVANRTMLDKDEATQEAEMHGRHAVGWGVLKHEGGHDDGVERTVTTTLIDVKREEEKARELADFLDETDGVTRPYDADPDLGPEYFKSFGVAEVALKGAEVVTTFQYEMIDDLTGLAKELGIADIS